MKKHRKPSLVPESINKLESYVNGLVEMPEFQKQVRILRKKYKLPKKGQKEFPSHLYSTDFFSRASAFSRKLGLGDHWGLVITHYVLHNKIDFDVSFGATQFIPLDLNHLLNWDGPYEFRDQLLPKARLADLKEAVQTYPVAILITPYASEREIIDYIKRAYRPSIQAIQELYQNPKVKIGKVRQRNQEVKKRNQFIYRNRALGAKELVSLVASKYGRTHDRTYINSIISKEKRRRTNMN